MSAGLSLPHEPYRTGFYLFLEVPTRRCPPLPIPSCYLSSIFLSLQLLVPSPPGPLTARVDQLDPAKSEAEQDSHGLHHEFSKLAPAPILPSGPDIPSARHLGLPACRLNSRSPP